MAGNNSVVGMETVTFTDNMSFDGTERGGAMSQNGELWIGSATGRHVRKSIPTMNANGNIQAGAGTLTFNPYNCSKWIVDPNSNLGTHTTITAALTAASSGQSVFIRPGTYTENITLKAGVNLVAFSGDGDTPNVTIVGKLTMTTAGTCSISNIRLQTNSDNFLAVTGSAASIVYLDNCYLNCTNNTGISFTSSSASSRIHLYNCKGDLVTTGIAYFAHSGAGSIISRDTYGFNSGLSTTANTISGSGSIDFYTGEYNNPFTFSSTSLGAFFGCSIYMNTNTTALTVGAGTTVGYYTGLIRSGTASAISVEGTCSCWASTLESSNASVVTGGGTFNYAGIVLNAGTGTIAATTSTPKRMWSGSYFGIQTNTSPLAGSIGEQIRSAVASGSAVSLVDNTAKTVTSISLTPGIWDVSIIANFIVANSTSVGNQAISISSTNNTMGAAAGDDGAYFNNLNSPIVGYAGSYSVPSYRVSLSATTTYYLVAFSRFTVSTSTVYGRISATRVA